MPAKSQTTPFLIFLVLLITFPIWALVGAGLIGVAAGLVGAVIGTVAGILGAIVGVFFKILFLPFRLIFGGHNDWNLFHTSDSTYIILAIILLVALIIQRKRSTN